MPPGREWMKMLGIKIRQPRHRPVKCETALEPGIWGQRLGVILLEFRCSSRVLKGRRGGCCLQELRGGEECLLDTGRKAAFVRWGLVKSSDTVVCGFVVKRG